MPRKITAEMTLDYVEDEILYSQAAIQADPDAADLLGMTSGWLGWVDEVRASDRTLRQSIANTDASRQVANQRLDYECLSFGKDLLYDLDNDRSAPRWTQFFSVAPSSFVRMPLTDEVATIKGWLSVSTDPVLENHRPDLTTWSTSADSALTATRALSTLRGQQQQAREDLAGKLTGARDALHRALAERAMERNLPRDWPDVFFRVETR